MDALALLRLANAVGGGSIGDGHLDIVLRAATDVVLAADHVGSGMRFRRGRSRGGGRVENRDQVGSRYRQRLAISRGASGHPVSGWEGRYIVGEERR